MEYHLSLQDAYGPPAPVRALASAGKKLQQRSRAAVERVMQALPIDPGNGQGDASESSYYEPFSSPAPSRLAATSYHEPTPDAQLMQKLQYAITMLERKTMASEPTGAGDVILYSFTGVFMLFVLDAFVRLGHKIDRL